MSMRMRLGWWACGWLAAGLVVCDAGELEDTAAVYVYVLLH
jgi:hypothetical protein